MKPPDLTHEEMAIGMTIQWFKQQPKETQDKFIAMLKVLQEPINEPKTKYLI